MLSADIFNLSPEQLAIIAPIVFTFFGMVFNVTSVQLKNRVLFLLFQCIACSFYITAGILLKAYMGASMNFISIVACVAFFLLEKKGIDYHKPICLAIFLPIYIAAYLMCVFLIPLSLRDSIISVFPVIAGTINIVSLFQKDYVNLKRWKIVVHAMWIIYSVFYGWGAIVGIINDTVTIIMVIINLCRLKKGSKKS